MVRYLVFSEAVILSLNLVNVLLQICIITTCFLCLLILTHFCKLSSKFLAFPTLSPRNYISIFLSRLRKFNYKEDTALLSS